MDEFYVIYPKLEDFAPANKRLPGNGSINTLLENFVDKLQVLFYLISRLIPKIGWFPFYCSYCP